MLAYPDQKIKKIETAQAEEYKRLTKSNDVLKGLKSQGSSQNLLGGILGIEENGQIIIKNGIRTHIIEIIPASLDTATGDEQRRQFDALHKVILTIPGIVQCLRILRPFPISNVEKNIIAASTRGTDDVRLHELANITANAARREAETDAMQSAGYYLVVKYDQSELSGASGIDVSRLSGAGAVVVGGIQQATKKVTDYFGIGEGQNKDDRYFADVSKNLELRVKEIVHALADSAHIDSRPLGGLSTLRLISRILGTERETEFTADDLRRLWFPIERSQVTTSDNKDIPIQTGELTHEHSSPSLGGTLNMRTVRDLLAPNNVYVDFDHDALRISGRFYRTLIIRHPPTRIPINLYGVLEKTNVPHTVSTIIEPINTDKMRSQLKHLSDVYRARLDKLEARGEKDFTAQKAYDDAEALLWQLETRSEIGCNMSSYVMVEGSSPLELDKHIHAITNPLKSLGFKISSATNRHDHGLLCMLPLVNDALGEAIIVDGRTAAAFAIASQEGLFDEKGFVWGKTLTGNRSLVLLDPTKLTNGNTAVIGSPGVGKSYFSKDKLVQAVSRGWRGYYIDPDCEGKLLCEMLGGQYVDLTAEENHINPLDFRCFRRTRVLNAQAEKLKGNKNPLDAHIRELMKSALPHMLSGGSLNDDQKACLSFALYSMYFAADITRDPETHDKPMPLLSDLQRELEAIANPQTLEGIDQERLRVKITQWASVASSMATRLETYTTGMYSPMFNHPTNLDFNCNFIAFGIPGIEDDEVLAPLIYSMIATCVWNQSSLLDDPAMLVFDEMAVLLATPWGAKFAYNLARRARKRNLYVLYCTQSMEDCTKSPEARAALNSMGVRVYLGQEDTGAAAIAATGGLTPEQVDFLLYAKDHPGTALLMVRRKALYMRTIVPEEFHSNFNTNVNQQVQSVA